MTIIKPASYIIGLMLLLPITVVMAISFPDVPFDHPHITAITYLAEKGVIQGYGDGWFRPDQAVSRAELLKILIKGAHGITPVWNPVEECFPDINKDQWFGPFVCYARTRKWVSGYGDGLFHPDNTVSKIEALKIILRSKEILVPDWSAQQLYPDVPKDTWYAPYIETARDRGLVDETIGRPFEPTAGMQRASVSEVIARLLSAELGDGRVSGRPIATATDLVARFANPQLTVPKGTRVFLDATTSQTGHRSVTFQWYTLESPTPDVPFDFSQPSRPSFLASLPGAYRFQLVIIDQQGKKSVPSEVMVTVTGAEGKELWNLEPNRYRAELEREVLEMINVSRRQGGLPDLLLDAAVSDVARGHSEDLARNVGTIQHAGSDGSHVGDRLKRASIKVRGAGENIGWSTVNIQTVLDGLQKVHDGMMSENPDPGPRPEDGNHRTTIMSKYFVWTHVGIGLYYDEVKKEVYVTSNFVLYP